MFLLKVSLEGGCCFPGFASRERSFFQKFTVYRKILIISTGLIFVQKAFLVGSFSGRFIWGGGGEFCTQKWFRLYVEGIFRLKISQDFASENAVPEGMWVGGGAIELPYKLTICMVQRNTFKHSTRNGIRQKNNEHTIGL